MSLRPMRRLRWWDHLRSVRRTWAPEGASRACERPARSEPECGAVVVSPRAPLRCLTPPPGAWPAQAAAVDTAARGAQGAQPRSVAGRRASTQGCAAAASYRPSPLNEGMCSPKTERRQGIFTPFFRGVDFFGGTSEPTNGGSRSRPAGGPLRGTGRVRALLGPRRAGISSGSF